MNPTNRERSPSEPTAAAGGFANIRFFVIVILSGFAGLTYQVAWTRQLINITSAAATAQALVLAVFMVGLGLGSWLGGRIAPRLQHPLRAYALLEVGAALFAGLSPIALHASIRLLPLMSKSVSSPLTASWIQLGLVGLLLLLPTTLLGMSLPLVIERTERAPNSSAAARQVNMGMLYGLNTLGAAVGALVAGFWTIENFGLSQTLRIGGAFAVAAAALAMIERRPLPSGKSNRTPTNVAAPESAGSTSPRRLLVAAFLSGAAGLGAEVVWTRLFSVFMPTTVYALSLVLAAVLVGVALGGGLAALLANAAKAHAAAGDRLVGHVVLLQAAAAVLTSLVGVVLVLKARDQDLGDHLASGGALLPLLFLMGVLIPPAALNAATLPLLASAAARLGNGARAFGTLYAANTAGCLTGSLLAGFVFLPMLGTQRSLMVIALLSLAVVPALLPLRAIEPKRILVVVASALVCILSALVIKIPLDIYQERLPPATRILDMVEGVTSDVMVTEDEQQSRRLWINSVYVAASGRHRLLGHLPALMVEHPQQVLGMALGTGQTFGAAIKHGAAHFDCVEINPEVIALSKRWFGQYNRGILDDPRVRITIADARTFLRTTTNRYDLMVIEPLQAWSAGTTALYTHEFYLEAKRALNAGGALAQWIPFYGQGVAETRAMVLTAIEVFPEASLWLDGADGILILRSERVPLSTSEFFARVRDRDLQADLEDANFERQADLLSLFIAGPSDLKAWASGAERVTDDRPFLEFVAARQFRSQTLPDILGSVMPHLGNIAAVLSVPESEPNLWPEAFGVRETMLAVLPPDAASIDRRAEILERGLASWPSSQRLATAYRSEIESWAAQLFKQPGGANATAKVLMRGLQHLPDFGEAAFQLAQLFAANGQVEQAIQIARYGLRLERTKPQMQALLDHLTEMAKRQTKRHESDPAH